MLEDLRVVLEEAEILADRYRNQRLVEIVVPEDLFLLGEIETLVAGKDLGDGLGHQPHEFVAGVIAGCQGQAVDGELLGEGREFVAGFDIADLVQIVGSLAQRRDQDTAAKHLALGDGLLG